MVRAVVLGRNGMWESIGCAASFMSVMLDLCEKCLYFSLFIHLRPTTIHASLLSKT